MSTTSFEDSECYERVVNSTEAFLTELSFRNLTNDELKAARSIALTIAELAYVGGFVEGIDHMNEIFGKSR